MQANSTHLLRGVLPHLPCLFDCALEVGQLAGQRVNVLMQLLLVGRGRRRRPRASSVAAPSPAMLLLLLAVVPLGGGGCMLVVVQRLMQLCKHVPAARKGGCLLH